jgi:oxaloacetate decarboxylase beta subunit
MALVPVVQRPIIRLMTTKDERRIRMDNRAEKVPKYVKILFPIFVTILAGIVAPVSVALIGMLMFGNLIRECGVLNKLSNAAQNELSNLITLFLGITIGSTMTSQAFLNTRTLLILAMGLVAFILDTMGGIAFAKIFNLFRKQKINPMIGAAGISAFPMSARVVHKLGLEEDPNNFLIMYATGANVAGQIGSVLAGSIVLALFI